MVSRSAHTFSSKSRLFEAALLVAGLNVVPLLAQPADAQGAITAPAAGVICDQAGPTCYDKQGPSIGLTQTYFGSIAANQLLAELRERPTANDFRLSNGSVCDLRAATCWRDGWQKAQMAPKLTQQLFGSLPTAANQSGGGLQGLQTPRAGIVCDPGSSPVCYDQSGLSLGLTREYFGTFAEQTALRNLGGQAPPRQFRLSNGSACDLNARTCWSDGWDRKQVNVALSNQLFGSANGAGTGAASTQTRAAQCRMTRWFKSLYNGNCELRENRTSKGRLLEVSLQDGNVYSVSKPRGGGYQLSDAKGNSWPVNVNDQGRSVSFTWSDRVLTVTPTAAPSSGNSFGQLLNNLMGP
jgi:uncharacterized protein (DUF779 family)